MQGQLDTLEDAGIKVYGISYDDISDIKEFSDSYGLEYNLLSDADSAVIKEVGILNTLIEPDSTIMSSAGKSYYGMPFPGVYVVDEQGLVEEKFFNRNYATRNSAGSLLNSALGEVLKPESTPEVDFATDQIEFSAFLADAELKLEYNSMLYVRFNVAEGLHIYADPLPNGFIATTVNVRPVAGLTIGEPKYPETELKAFEALDVELPVYNGEVDVAVPIRANAEVANWTIRNKPDSLDVTIDVRYQVCSETFCYLPKVETLTMTVPLGPMI